jgi:hypothetical protein
VTTRQAVIDFHRNRQSPRHNLTMHSPPPDRTSDLQNVSELIRDAAKSISRLDDLSKDPPQLSAATRGALIRVLKHDLAQIARCLPHPEPHSLAEEIAAFAELESRLDGLHKP